MIGHRPTHLPRRLVNAFAVIQCRFTGESLKRGFLSTFGCGRRPEREARKDSSGKLPRNSSDSWRSNSVSGREGIRPKNPQHFLPRARIPRISISSGLMMLNNQDGGMFLVCFFFPGEERRQLNLTFSRSFFSGEKTCAFSPPLPRIHSPTLIRLNGRTEKCLSPITATFPFLFCQFN